MKPITRIQHLSVLLATLFLLSAVISGPVAATLAQQHSVDAEIEQGGNYWLGQELAFQDNALSGDSAVRVVDDDTGDLVFELEVVDDDVVIIDTERLSTGSFSIERQNGDPLVSFSVTEQSMVVEPSSSTAENGGQLSEVDIAVESNRNGYTLVLDSVTYQRAESEDSEPLPRSLISQLFVTELTFEDATEDGTENAVFENFASIDELTVDFDGFSPGTYEFTLRVIDTNIDETISIEVIEEVDSEGSFSAQFYESHRGNIVEIPFDLENTQNATVLIGSEDMDYTLEAEISLDDEADVDETALLFDTTVAGVSTAETPTVSLKDDAGSVSLVSETIISDGVRLFDGQYLLELRIEDETVDFAAIVLQPIEVTGAQSHVVPGDVSTTDIEDVLDVASERISVSTDDYFLAHFEIDGLNKFLTSQESAEDFRVDSKSANRNYVFLEVVERNPVENALSQRLDVGLTTVYNSPDDNGVFVLIDPSVFTGVSDEDIYDVQMTILDENKFVEETIFMSTPVRFQETVIDVERADDGTVELSNTQAEIVRAETNLAPGREVTLSAQSDKEFPFFTDSTVQVSNESDLEFVLDMGTFAAPLGYEFEVVLPEFEQSHRGEIVSEEIEIDEPEQELIAAFTSSIESPTVNETVIFDATASQPEGDITSYEWEVEPGVTKKGQIIEHQFTEAGTYFVDLTVVTGDSEVQTVTEAILVEELVEVDDGFRTLTVSSFTTEGEPLDANVIIDGTAKIGSTVEFELEDGEYQVIVNADGYSQGEELVQIEGENTAVALELVDPTAPSPGQPGFGVVGTILALLLGFGILRRRR